MKALILAAGRGERLRPLTDTTPKPLIEVAGKKLVDHNLEFLSKYSIDSVVVNVSYLANKIIDYLGDRVLFSYERERLGTAGAVYKLRDWFDNNFVVVNGDTIHNIDMGKMVQSHIYSNAMVTIFTKDTDVHNGGVFIFNYRVFMYLTKGIFSIHEELIPMLSALGETNLYNGGDDEYYFDIGTVEKLKIAEDYLLSHK